MNSQTNLFALYRIYLQKDKQPEKFFAHHTLDRIYLQNVQYIQYVHHIATHYVTHIQMQK